MWRAAGRRLRQIRRRWSRTPPLHPRRARDSRRTPQSLHRDLCGGGAPVADGPGYRNRADVPWPVPQRRGPEPIAPLVNSLWMSAKQLRLESSRRRQSGPDRRRGQGSGPAPPTGSMSFAARRSGSRRRASSAHPTEASAGSCGWARVVDGGEAATTCCAPAHRHHLPRLSYALERRRGRARHDRAGARIRWVRPRRARPLRRPPGTRSGSSAISSTS